MPHDDRVIDQVQSLNDIVDIISGYIPLKRAGRSFKACCPFHQEKTPSFMVNPEKQIFHCFGCGVGGDVFSFLMKYEQLTFPEALKRLAERVHVALPETRQVSPKERSETEELYQIYALASEFYHQWLIHPESGKVGRNYLASRKFGNDVIEAFKLGYAPNDWRKLYEFLSKKGIKEQSLFRAGVVQRTSQGKPYDLFRNRIMFPILNAQGKAMAMGGRVLGNETPKYLNSPESPIFKKRQELYGLHLAKQAIAAMGDIRRIMIVEGYLDAIRLHASSFKNAVATLGTSLTNEHVRMMKRYADEAIVVFDGDKAGEQASLRGLDIFLEEGMSVKVLSLPKGFDPDSLIQLKGPEAMARLIDESQDVFDFKLQVLLKRFNRSDSLGLLKITGEFLDTFSKIQNPVLLDRYLKKLAVTLGIEEESLRVELKKIKGKQNRTEQGRASKAPAPPVIKKESDLEKTLLSLMIQYPKYFQQFHEAFPQYSFLSERIRDIMDVLEETVRSENKHTYTASMLMNRIENDNLKRLISELLSTSWETQEMRDQIFRDCIRKLQDNERVEKLRILRGEIARAEELGNQELMMKSMKAYQELLGQS